MKSRKVWREGMILPREKMLLPARDAEGYKYLGILGEKKSFMIR